MNLIGNKELTSDDKEQNDSCQDIRKRLIQSKSCGYLAGSSVQKVLVGREIASAPTVLMTAYAVRGLDINSSYTIYNLINAQKEKGTAVIFVGEDLDVLLELSDRILVLCGGRVSGILDGRTADKNTVGMMMTRIGGGAE